MRQIVCYTSVAPHGTLDAAHMYPQILLVTILMSSSVNGEKATSYVSVSKGKEGGYSYEVIHDYPTKDSTASVHVFSDGGFDDKPPDVSYDYGAKIPADVAPRPEKPLRSPAKKSPGRGRGKKQKAFENVPYHRNPVNDINSYGVIKQTATATGNVNPAGQVHSSAYVNIKHNMRAQSSGTGHLKSQGLTSYSYDIGNKDNAFHGSQALSDGKPNPLDSGGSIHASASGPGFSYSDPNTIRALSADYGPISSPIIYHHHHYLGDTVNDGHLEKPNEDNGFDFGKGFFGKTETEDEHRFHQNDHSYGNTAPNLNTGHVGSISIEATLGHTCSTGEVTPLPHFHPRKPDDGFFNYAQDYDYGHGSNNLLAVFNGYDYPAPLQNFHTGHSSNGLHTGGKKGKWKPVIITSSKSKGKLHTFRISRDFKPGQLMGGFKPSFGPPEDHKTAGHLRSIGHDIGGHFGGQYSGQNVGQNGGQFSGHKGGDFSGHNDPFADFHDAPYFDYDSILSSLENGPGDHTSGDGSFSHSFEEFPEYSEGGEKSLKDYHNSLTYPSKPQYRRSKKLTHTSSLSSKPIVVLPLKSTTVHSATTVTSPIPGVDVTSFLNSPSPLAVHAPDITSRNYPINSESDQATSYANPNNLSLRRNNKRKNG